MKAKSTTLFLFVLLVAGGVGAVLITYNYKADLRKACSQERVMLATGIPFHNAPDAQACAGHKIVNLETGTYELGGLTFRIPRAYLWQEKYSDGKVEDIYLNMYYPSLEPERTDSNGLDPSLVSFKIHQCYLKQCQSTQTPDYNLEITIPRYKPLYSKSEYVSELSLHRYTITDRAPKPERTEVYYEGDRENPSYWFACLIDKPNPLCLGDFWYRKGNISVSFHFNYKQLNQHKKITDGIIKKVDEFVKQ